jgi:DNA processing protein
MVASITKWLTISRTKNIGSITVWKWIRKGLSADSILEEISNNNRYKMPLEKEIKNEIKLAEKNNILLITPDCHIYPELLKEIDDPPIVISYLGNISLIKNKCIAIVGARNASINASNFAYKISKELSEKYTIVSGFARGIDIKAHIGAMDSNSHKSTIAVFAGGIGNIYPSEHKKYYERILENGGAVISECSFNSPPTAQHFPKRNRIVSGLSLGIVLIEAAPKSGSLITARMALEQNRELMVIPGSPTDYRCQGGNNLIKQGANLITCSEDVDSIISNVSLTNNSKLNNISVKNEYLFKLEENNIEYEASSKTVSEISNEISIVMEMLSSNPIFIDELKENLPEEIRKKLPSIMLQLESTGKISRISGGRIQKIS